MGPKMSRRQGTSSVQLKNDLQTLGLCRAAVRRGLIQLVTEPHVVLPRCPVTRKYRSLREEQDARYSGRVGDSKIDIPFLEKHSDHDGVKEDAEPADAGEDGTECSDENGGKLRKPGAHRCGPKSYLQRLAASNENSDTEKINSHAFDSALVECDQTCVAKAEVHERFTESKGHTAVSFEATCKLEANILSTWDTDTCSNNNSLSTKSMMSQTECESSSGHEDSNKSIEQTTELLLDEFGSEPLRLPVQIQRSKIKLNLSPYNRRQKEGSGRMDLYKKHEAKENSNSSNKDSDSKTTNVEDNVRLSEKPCSTQYENRVDITAKETSEETVRRKRSHQEVAADETVATKKVCSPLTRKEKVKKRFRRLFGECLSISEAEEEKRIARKVLKKKRLQKKNSVDSGVCTAEENCEAASCIEIVKEIQKTMPDSTMEEYDDQSSTTSTNVETCNEMREVTCDAKDELLEKTAEPKINRVTSDARSPPTDAEETMSETSTILNEVRHVEESKVTTISFAKTENLPATEKTTLFNEVYLTEDSERRNIAARDKQTEKSNVTTTFMSETEDISSMETITLFNQDYLAESTTSSDIAVICHKIEKPKIVPTSVLELELLEESLNFNDQVVPSESISEHQDDDSVDNFDEPALIIDESAVDPLATDGADAEKNVVGNRIDEPCNLTESLKVESNFGHVTNDKEKTENICLENSVPVNIEKNNNELPNLLAADQPQKDTEIITAENNAPTVSGDANPSKNRTDVGNSVKPNVAPKLKLRVLSSAELGSRWCPTPLQSTASSRPQSSSASSKLPSSKASSHSVNIPKLTVPAEQTIPTSVPATSPTFRQNSRCPQMRITKTLLIIFKLISESRQIRVQYTFGSKTSNDKLQSSYIKCTTVLLKELENLGKLMKSTNYKDVVKSVVSSLNGVLFKSLPCSFEEIAFYCPQHMSLYYSDLNTACKPSLNNFGAQSLAAKKPANTAPATQLHDKPRLPQKMPPLNSTPAQCPMTAPVAQPSMISSSLNHTPSNNVFLPQQRPQTAHSTETSFLKNCRPMSCNLHCDLQQMQYKIPPPQTQPTIPERNSYSGYAGNKLNPQDAQISQRFSAQFGASACNTPFSPPPYFNSSSTQNKFVQNQYVPRGQCTPQLNSFPNNFPSRLGPQMMNIPRATSLRTTNTPLQNQQFQFAAQLRPPVYGMPQQMPRPTRSHFPQNMPQNVPLQKIPQTSPMGYHPSQTDHSVKTPAPSVLHSMLQKENIQQHTPANIPQNSVPEKKAYAKCALPLNVNSPNLTPQTRLLLQKPGIEIRKVDTKNCGPGVLSWLTTIQKQQLIDQLGVYFIQCAVLQPHMTAKQRQDLQSCKSLLTRFKLALTNDIEETIKQLNLQIHGTDLKQQTKTTVPEDFLQTQNLPQCRVKTTGTSGDQQRAGLQDKIELMIQKKLDSVNKIAANTSTAGLPERTQDLGRSTEVNKPDEKISGKPENQTCKEVPPSAAQPDEQRTLNQPLPSQPCSLEQQLQMLEGMCKTIQEFAQDLPATINSEKREKITSTQSSPRLVTVEISPNDNHVKVIEVNENCVSKENVVTNAANQNEECRQESLEDRAPSANQSPLPSSKDCVPDISTVLVHGTFDDNIELPEEKDLEDDTSEENVISHIADVRSIPIDEFERIGENEIANAENESESQEEADLKICLQCSKIGTVVCEICLEALYCSKRCSDLHWEEHYVHCKPRGPRMELTSSDLSHST